MSFSRQPARCQVLAISIFALFLGACAAAQSEATPPDGNQPATTPPAGAPSAAVRWGTVKGKVIVDGEVSVPPIIRKGDMKVKDPDVCAANDIPDESLIVDPATSGLANVVIYLKKKPEHIHPLLKDAANVQLQFLAKGCRYSPHIYGLAGWSNRDCEI